MADATHVLTELRKRIAGGQDVAALDLHMEALLAAHNGDLSGAASCFTTAQKWESAHGYGDGALHTSHQMALTVNFAGDLDKLHRYYEETTITLSKMRNRKGVALCMRSVGEIAIVRGNAAEWSRAWDLSERLFTMLGLPEASQIAVWRQCLLLTS